MESFLERHCRGPLFGDVAFGEDAEGLHTAKEKGGDSDRSLANTEDDEESETGEEDDEDEAGEEYHNPDEDEEGYLLDDDEPRRRGPIAADEGTKRPVAGVGKKRRHRVMRKDLEAIKHAPRVRWGARAVDICLDAIREWNELPGMG